jgi:putative nucleotidyltransferase with HDIG domain
MSKIKIPVDSLRLGMYVAELDRPWIETPFLFQGFILEREDDIRELGRYCRHVFVDNERSLTPVEGSGRAEGQATEATDIKRAEPITADRERFISVARESADHREMTHDYLRHAFRDVRLGGAVDVEEAKSVVGGLVDTVSNYPDVSIWLTQMKERDEYTTQHCLNVCVLTVAFCRHLGITGDDLKTIGLGALLHDIGKSVTPLDVLNKPERLTPSEWETIKRHPVDGYEMMKKTGKVPEPALAIIRLHHLRHNGAGYPDDLASTELSTPIMAAAIADVYDAMTSDRPYRDALPADQALRLMHKDSHDTFGQDLMESFIRCVGIFPVGSLVELNNDVIAMVVSTNDENRLLPRVMLVKDPDGNPYRQRRLADLATLAERGESHEWSVRRVVNANEYGLRPIDLILGEIR